MCWKFESKFSGVVVGQIVKCVLHSEFHHLKVLKVDIGKKVIKYCMWSV